METLRDRTGETVMLVAIDHARPIMCGPTSRITLARMKRYGELVAKAAGARGAA